MQKVLNRLSLSIKAFKSNKPRFYSLLALLMVWIAIAAVNFPKDSYLSGWDNLHPEFDIGLNLKRAIFGVWQEHQGLGHVGGHGYAASLPHTILTGIMSIVVPTIYIRSLFTFIALLTGSTGCFFLVSHLLKNKQDLLRYLSALVGALFYMLNFATIQQFYVQLEPFIIQFAFLPWSFLLIFLLLEKFSRKLLILFFITNLFLTTQGFVPPLFVIYIISVSLIFAVYVVSQRSLKNVKKTFFLLLIIFCINSFWLLSFLHYVKTGSQVFLNSTNNILSTQGWIDTNSKYGNFENLSILKGFPSQAIDEVTDKGIVYIFQPWLNHLSLRGIQILGYLFFGIIIVGLMYFVLSRRPKYELGLLLIFLLTFSILATDIPLLSSLSALIQKLPLFRQSFRAGFTKLAITLALMYSVFFAMGVAFVANSISGFLKSKGALLSYILTTFVIILICVFSLPVFQGNLFYSKAKLKVPEVYFEMFEFFKNQDPTGRVALLPQGTHWGWDTYKWGYTGSGFPWFGLSQPIMERAFDVWSNFNENYYWELSYALYSQNPTILEKVIEKYKIAWVVFDQRLIPYSGKKYPFQTEKMLGMLEKSEKFELVERFHFDDNQNEFLYVFKTKLDHQDDKYIQIISSLTLSSRNFQWNTFDNLFNTFGTYYSSPNSDKASDVDFPFKSLFSYRKQEELEFKAELTNEDIVFEVPIEANANVQNIVAKVTSELADEPIISGENFTVQEASPSVYINDQKNKTLTVKIPKLKFYSSFDSNDSQNIEPVITHCSNTTGESHNNQRKELNKTIYNFDNTDSSTCFDLFLGNLTHKYGYLAMIESKNIEGNPLLFTLINATTKRNDFETILPQNTSLSDSYYVIPPMAADGLGYSIRLSNISIGKRKAVNEVGRIAVYPIPFQFLTTMHIIKGKYTNNTLFTDPNQFSVQHTNPFTYTVNFDSQFESNTNNFLILNQGFDRGWKAWSNGKELKDHVLINNWANGWRLDGEITKQSNNAAIMIVFWPQYLEFIGFILLHMSFVWIFLRKNV